MSEPLGASATSDAWDLRRHLRDLDRHGLLARITAPVDAATEAAQLMADLERRRLAGVFTGIGGSTTPLAYNLLGDRRMVALALGVAPDQVQDAFRQAWLNPVPPQTADAPAPSQEIVLEGDDADLAALPMVVHSARDNGRYITAGMVLTNDLRTGRRNISFNRICPVGPREAGIRMMPPQHLGVIQARAEEDGKDLPIAVAVGMHPTAELGAAASPAFGQDELGIIGGLRHAPVRLVPGVTVPIDVPAEAEFVIEGYVRAGVREPEGPFGDFLQYYVPVMDNHRFRVTAITHRSEAIYRTMHAGSAEDVQVLGLSREVDILQAVRATGAQVVAVRLNPTILGAVVAIDQRYAGEAKSVGMAALAAYRWLKYCVVVDRDVDVVDSDDVWWAIATRTALDRDLVVVPASGGFPRDEGGMHDSRLFIDATAPIGGTADFTRRVPPGTGRLRLEDFVSEGGIPDTPR